jgi:hypothetical protein
MAEFDDEVDKLHLLSQVYSIDYRCADKKVFELRGDIDAIR